MSSPFASIVIINYNTFELTCQCLASIYKECKSEFEIIVVDNASTECDPETIKTIFPLVILIKSENNIGFSKGNNLGILSAKGEYILLLNSDTTLKNDAISICKTFLQEHRKVAVASSRLEYPDGCAQHNCQRFPSVRYKLFELLRLQKMVGRRIGGKVLFGSFFDYQSIAYPDWVWGTFFMFKKELLERLPQKKLNDDFFMYGEDMQWCMDIKKLGLKCAFVPEARVVHFLGKSGGNKGEWMNENMNVFLKKNYSGFHRSLIKWLDRLLS